MTKPKITPNTRTDHTYIPADIEATGLGRQATITTLTYAINDIFHVIVNTNQQSEVDAGLLEEQAEAETGLDVTVHTVENEKQLLSFPSDHDALQDEKDNAILVMHNGETWRGGYDIPTLRTKAWDYNIPHPFRGWHLLDTCEIIGQRENVNLKMPDVPMSRMGKDKYTAFAEMHSIPGTDGLNKDPLKDAIKEFDYTAEMVIEWAEEHLDGDTPLAQQKTLDGAYEAIVWARDPHPEIKPEVFDPFNDSEEAVEAWEEGNLIDIAVHNLADVYMTDVVSDFIIMQASPDVLDPSVL